jgi:class 3 adenylate cyclase/CHAT domain-containing protein/predicted negative regulator of RcsB-dependent stress response
MIEDDHKKIAPQSGDIARVLRERERLDQLIEQRFRKKRAILFTDVSGFTQYMHKMGDLRGRAWIQKHHDIVIPLIEKYHGEVVDVMGDGIMASFPDTLSAVNASIAIQKGLNEHNAKTKESDRIHVRIGINTGEIFVEKNHIAGDAVNVAARIQTLAEPNQILISKSAYEDVSEESDILCRFHKKARIKGKPEALELYRIIWKEEDFVLSDEPRVRAPGIKKSNKMGLPQSVLQIDVARVNNHLKISACEQIAGQTNTVRQYEDLPISMDEITTRCRGMIETLNKANRKGRITHDILMKLRSSGQVLSDELFTQNVKEIVSNTKADHLAISLEDKLVQIPWELFFDGRRFLCQRFSMGRLVRTKQSVAGIGRVRALARPLKMLILADPKGDLKEAYLEGTQIRDYLDREKRLIHASLQTDNVSSSFIKERMRNFDLLHFAGHHDYDWRHPQQSGWRLTDGRFEAQDILKMGGTGSMPALIFSNACQSARTEEWGISANVQNEIFGLANAFILAGVKHYIGTFWEVLDEPSRRFALNFYKNILKGYTIGDAIRLARLAVIDEYGEETIVWASYLLYGDPAFNYMDQVRALAATESGEHPHVKLPETDIRSREEVIDFAGKKDHRTWRLWIGSAVGSIILLLILFFGYPGLLKKDSTQYEQAALKYFTQGDYEKALQAALDLVKKNASIGLGYLIEGEIYFRKGDLDSARAAFQKALKAAKTTAIEKARALMGLGRIAALAKQTDDALHYYKMATEAAPASESGYLSQALLLDAKGNHEEALNLLTRASQLAPDDFTLAAIAAETRKKIALQNDREKQDRINTLVKELLATMAAKPDSAVWDGWSARPLTLWIMDFGVQGYTLQEGEDRLIVAGLTDHVLQNSRAQIVERALLDSLLQELKLGSSNLADRDTALALGKILAARLILSGQIIYSGPETHISMRLIETETGRVAAAFSETIGAAAPVSVLTGKLSEKLITKLNQRFPLRGKILNQKGQIIQINIGNSVGLKLGQLFTVVNEPVHLEVIDIQEDSCFAKILNGDKPLEIGQRVEVKED